MLWEQINIGHERLNGLKLRVAQITPTTTAPKLLDHILQKEGVFELTDEELKEKLQELEAVVK